MRIGWPDDGSPVGPVFSFVVIILLSAVTPVRYGRQLESIRLLRESASPLLVMRMPALMPLTRCISKEKIVRYHQRNRAEDNRDNEQNRRAFFFAELFRSLAGSLCSLGCRPR